MISAIQRGLGESAEAAGSCVIPSMGKEEAGRFLILCNALGKRAVFVFDLDALFDRRLRIGVGQRPDLAERIAAAGHGEYDKFVGQLQRALTLAAQALSESDASKLPSTLAPLRVYFEQNPGSDNLDKRRLAVLLSIAEHPMDVRAVLGEGVDAIQGYHRALLAHLSGVDIHVLPGGALENYLPSYVGNRFSVPDNAKRGAVLAEQSWLSTGHPAVGAIEARYGELARVVRMLPARPAVDLYPVLRRELANLLHQAVMAIRAGWIKTKEDVPTVLAEDWKRVANFMAVARLDISGDDSERRAPAPPPNRPPSSFSGELVVLDKFGIGPLRCVFDERTQTNDPSSLRLEKAQ